MPNLICHAADGTSFEVQPQPGIAPGFHERGHYRLTLDHASPCRLVLDDVELTCTRSVTGHVWEWQPGYYAGAVVAELFNDCGAKLACYRLDVSPQPGKLGQPLFQAMVDQLLEADPQLLFGAEAAQHAIGVAGDVANPHLAYSRLKLFGPHLLQAARQVCAHPLSRLSSERRLEPPHRVRRFDQQTLQAMARDPLALASLGHGQRAGADLDRVRFNVPVSREELDTPAHRTLLFTLVAVIRRIRRVRDELKRLATSDSAERTRTAMGPRLEVRLMLLDELESALRKVCQARPFSEVSRMEVSAGGLNVIAGHPLYARAFRGGWKILRPGVEGDETTEMLPVSPTWEIYERWCFLRVVNALQEMFPTLSWSRRAAGSMVDRILFEGKGDGVAVRARMQANFPAMDKAKVDGFYSISAERRPDIVVTCQAGSVRRMVVLDAKYSVSRERVLGAMESAHIYRDSLRWDKRAPDLSLLLVPSGGGAAWLENAEFQQEHGVGVLALSPDTGFDRVKKILAAVLRSDECQG